MKSALKTFGKISSVALLTAGCSVYSFYLGTSQRVSDRDEKQLLLSRSMSCILDETGTLYTADTWAKTSKLRRWVAFETVKFMIQPNFDHVKRILAEYKNLFSENEEQLHKEAQEEYEQIQKEIN